MRSPKSIDIFGTTYTIQRVSSIDDGSAHGECNTDKHIIRIDSKLKGQMYWETLLHEVFHAVCHECSIRQAISSELEEVIVDIFAKQVARMCDLSHQKRKGHRQ